MVTLGELADHPDLGLLLVAGPHDALSRSVAGSYIVRTGQAIHWPGPDWIMLLGGESSGDAESQRLVIRGSARQNLCAVAMRNGEVHESAIQQAKTDDVALLTVRSDVSFRLIGYFIERRLLQEDSHLTANLHAAQWAMMDGINLLGKLANSSGHRESANDLADLAEMLWARESVGANGPLDLGLTYTEFQQGMRAMAIAQVDGSVKGLLDKVNNSLITDTAIPKTARQVNGAVLFLIPEQLAPGAVISAIDCPLRAGLSERIGPNAEVGGAARDALAALRIAQWRGAPTGTIYNADELTSAEWLIGSADLDELRRRVRQRFGHLRNLPELSMSLRRWLAEDRNIRTAAAALHIHSNTLRYRLSRIEELTSCKLSEVSGLAELYLSLLAFPGELGMATGHGD